MECQLRVIIIPFPILLLPLLLPRLCSLHSSFSVRHRTAFPYRSSCRPRIGLKSPTWRRSGAVRTHTQGFGRSPSRARGRSQILCHFCLKLGAPSLYIPRSLHKTIGDRAFPVAAAKVWNMLSPTSLPSLETFKRALKMELWNCSVDHTATHTTGNIDTSVTCDTQRP